MLEFLFLIFLGLFLITFVGACLAVMQIATTLRRIVDRMTQTEAQPFDYHAGEQGGSPRIPGSFFRSNQTLRRPGEGDDEVKDQ